MRTKGHCVIVVAEGCGDTLIQSSGEKDAGAAPVAEKWGQSGSPKMTGCETPKRPFCHFPVTSPHANRWQQDLGRCGAVVEGHHHSSFQDLGPTTDHQVHRSDLHVPGIGQDEGNQPQLFCFQFRSNKSHVIETIEVFWNGLTFDNDHS